MLVAENVWEDNKHNNLHFALKIMLGYLSLDIISSLELTVFLALCSQKTVRFSEQIMSADKYLSIFLRQMETIVYFFMFICCSRSVEHTLTHLCLKQVQRTKDKLTSWPKSDSNHGCADDNVKAKTHWYLSLSNISIPWFVFKSTLVS